jgi:hypothetical protein
MRYDPSTSADRRIFMRKHSWMLTVCLMVGLFAAPARAQTPSPDALAAARELIVALGGADQIKATMPIVMKKSEARDRPESARSRARLRCDVAAHAANF